MTGSINELRDNGAWRVGLRHNLSIDSNKGAMALCILVLYFGILRATCHGVAKVVPNLSDGVTLN